MSVKTETSIHRTETINDTRYLAVDEAAGEIADRTSKGWRVVAMCSPNPGVILVVYEIVVYEI